MAGGQPKAPFWLAVWAVIFSLLALAAWRAGMFGNVLRPGAGGGSPPAVPDRGAMGLGATAVVGLAARHRPAAGRPAAKGRSRRPLTTPCRRPSRNTPSSRPRSYRR